MTDVSGHGAPSKVPRVNQMAMGDLWYALRMGARDFYRKPMMGLFFSHVYVVGGWLIYLFLFVTEQEWWAIPFTVGFPLLGPFLAVGLYEVSRRLEIGDTDFRRNDIFGVIWRQRLRQLPSMAWVVIVYFLFWSFFAHMLFALFLGPSVLTNVTTSYAYLLEPEGVSMLVVGTAFGAVFALVLFALTVVSLPLLLDKELDFVTAMLTSIKVVQRNKRVMLVWAATIAGLTFLGLMPFLVGLFVVLPILGHATWHIYRRALTPLD
ncbi:Permease of the major facilitator superfamily [Roseibacterium elongatum DSM 19469]|uniref:Permease of the major facilitator superfamily n=1 Tax=Roseicyclus elongatus DSM 19469 TaxID=1294273 RepID=W8S7N1_9RHOB|nr:DUF2189 domain-containing protein [Roseibacterium elongatum]AHM04911.1 Permease of the major facilitator superfamily [Roseibacterium elongatum DSM 19469]